jgi:hypothetical protein
MRPLLRAASAYSGDTASATNTEPATIAASAKLNPAGIFFSASSADAEDATGAMRTDALDLIAARDLRGNTEHGVGVFVLSFGEVKDVVSRGRSSNARRRRWRTSEIFVRGKMDAAICGTRAHLTAAPAKEARRAATGRARTVCVGVSRLDRGKGTGSAVRSGWGRRMVPTGRANNEMRARYRRDARGFVARRVPASRTCRETAEAVMEAIATRGFL